MRIGGATSAGVWMEAHASRSRCVGLGPGKPYTTLPTALLGTQYLEPLCSATFHTGCFLSLHESPLWLQAQAMARWAETHCCRSPHCSPHRAQRHHWAARRTESPRPLSPPSPAHERALTPSVLDLPASPADQNGLRMAWASVHRVGDQANATSALAAPSAARCLSRSLRHHRPLPISGLCTPRSPRRLRAQCSSRACAVPLTSWRTTGAVRPCRPGPHPPMHAEDRQPTAVCPFPMLLLLAVVGGRTNRGREQGDPFHARVCFGPPALTRPTDRKLG